MSSNEPRQGGRKDAIESLGREVQEARRRKGWAVARLAREGCLSPETIKRIESGSTGLQRSIRADVIVKIARAVGASDQVRRRWLSLAGHQSLSHAKMEAVLSRLSEAKPGLIPPPPCDPLAFFDELSKKIVKDQTIMCECYTSKPAAVESVPVQDRICECIEKGLWLAMTCPYPYRARRPDLTRLNEFYSSVRNGVADLARTLSNKIRPEFRRQIAVFVPAVEDHSVAPPLRLAAYRPTLVHFKGSPERDEVGVWLQLGLGAPDNWLRVVSPDVVPLSDEEKKSAQNTLETWREYFDDILQAWESDSTNRWTVPKNGNWVRES